MKKRNIGLVTNSSSGGWSNFNELSYTDIISSLKSDYFFFRVFDRKDFGRFHPLGWNSKKLKVFNFQATN